MRPSTMVIDTLVRVVVITLLVVAIYIWGKDLFDDLNSGRTVEARGNHYVTRLDPKGTCQTIRTSCETYAVLNIGKYFPVAAGTRRDLSDIALRLRSRVLADSMGSYSYFEVNFDSTDQGAMTYRFFNQEMQYRCGCPGLDNVIDKPR